MKCFLRFDFNSNDNPKYLLGSTLTYRAQNHALSYEFLTWTKTRDIISIQEVGERESK